jgi:hypothetical protein
MPLNALELAEYLQSQAQGCKDLSNALADARLRMVPFDEGDPSPYADLLREKAARVIDFLDELETSLNKLSDELYTEGWE